MDGPKILHLKLLSPLVCAVETIPAGALPSPAGEERLSCFEINGAQGQALEPESLRYLGPLRWRGTILPEPGRTDGLEELPPGDYLFAQERALLREEAVINLALEIQKEGIWEGLALENRLYLRVLSEDGSFVTQLFRPLAADKEP